MRGSVFKRGRTWTYVLSLGRDPRTDKKRQRWVGGFKTKADAELALTRALAAHDGGAVPVATTSLTVAQFLDEWLEAVRPSLRATTNKSYVGTMHGHVTPRIGHLRLTRLNVGHLRALYGELRASGRRRGLRRGEGAGLRWDDVDLERREMAIRRTRVVVGWEVQVSEPKTRSSRRTVSLDPTTVNVLRAHRARQIEERLAWGPAWQDSGYVFCSEDGQPVHPQRMLSGASGG